jgi:hypothetical protein
MRYWTVVQLSGGRDARARSSTEVEMALELRNQFSHGRASLQYVRNLAAVQQCPLMAFFGPDARARRCLFVGIKRTSLKNAPRIALDPGCVKTDAEPGPGAEVQSTTPCRRYRDLYEGSKMLSRSTDRLAGRSTSPRSQRKGRSGDENPPRAVDRQSTPSVPVRT